MTRTELLTIRDQTYKPPPERRCETCRHSGLRAVTSVVTYCWLTENGSYKPSEMKAIHRAGVCDLWESRP